MIRCCAEMARVVIVLVVLCCTAKVTASHKHHPKFQKTDDLDQFKKEACSSHNDRLRNAIIKNSTCGEPKEVFVDLKHQVSYIRVVPSKVWVKRCVGLCDSDSSESQCVATKSRMEAVPVRLYNSKTYKENCATIEVEVHESCACCSTKASDCASPRVYNPRKCSCQCPNMEDRRSCLKKRSQNMRWNRSKCACEAKKRAPW